MVLVGEDVVLAQRVPDPVVGQQDVARIGVALERDAEHLRALALVPLRRAVDGHARRDHGRGLRDEALDRQTVAPRDREQLDVEPQVRIVLRRIRRGQVELYGKERAIATALDYTRYDKVVEAIGGFGAYVEKTADVGPAIDAALASGKPACVNVKIASSDFRKGAISV